MNHATCSHVRRDSYIRVIWLIHMCDVNHSCIWHDSTRSYVWRDFLFVCGRTYDSYVRWDLFICVTGLFHMCDVAILVSMRSEIHLLRCILQRDSFIRVTGLFHICDVTLLVSMGDEIHRDLCWRVALHICAARLFYTCDRTLSYVWYDITRWTRSYVRRNLFYCVAWIIRAARLFHMNDRTFSYVWCDITR